MRIGVTFFLLAASAVVIFCTAPRAAWAAPTATGQHLVTQLPVIAIDSVGLTLGGKTGAWGSTLSLDQFDVNPIHFEWGRCGLEYAYSVKNVGHVPASDVWAVIYSDDMPAMKEFVTNLPPIDPGKSSAASGWFPMSAGKHQVYVAIKNYDPNSHGSSYTSVNVNLAAHCAPATSLLTKVQTTAAMPFPSIAPTQPMPATVRQHRLTKAEFQADIAQPRHMRSGKLHAVMKNPNAKTRTATILRRLQNQKTIADTEFARLRALPHVLVQPAVPTVGAGQTQSANGSGSPQPVAAQPSTSGAPSMQLSANTRTQMCYHGPDATPGIRTVNGSAHATFTPTKSYDLYTIVGCNFGDSGSTAKAWIYGSGFKQNFQILAWSDTSVAVMLDPNLSGVQDQDNLTLVVQTSDGKEAQASGFAFYAARDSVQLASIPQSQVHFASSLFDPSLVYASPTTAKSGVPQGAVGSTNFVSRSWSDKTTPSSDYYDFSNLPADWVVSAVSWGQYDGSCYGVVTYKEDFGSWGPQFDTTGNNFNFQWGDTSCSGWMPNPFPWMGWYSNTTQSGYALQVWVDGPRGTENLLPH